MNEQDAKHAIATTFIGAWLANNYSDACSMGQHDRLNEPPIEDAEFLAEQAILHWKKVGTYIGVKP